MKREIGGPLIGTSRRLQQLQQELACVARSDAKVLITGESGVGKELVARAIHFQSARSARALVSVNCAGLPDSLLESELFGHVKGSFTSAYRESRGKLASANGSTLFLDEVAEMSLRMQALLLRFTETGELQQVGAEHAPSRVDVRLIAATNGHLREMVAQRRFREDLFFRLNVIHVAVPPLRDRREDIPDLLAHFLARFSADNGRRVDALSPEALQALVDYDWPGNVRELVNVVERVVVTARGSTIEVGDLPVEVHGRRERAVDCDTHRPPTVADDLYKRLTAERESFWSAVYPLYMRREITREHLRDVVRRGLRESRGSYKIVARMFNMEDRDYKRFLNFLRAHDCQLPFKEYRQ